MTVNRSDFVGKPQRSSVDADALGIYWDPTDPQGEPFVAPMNAHDASAISFSATGNLSSTDVQAAIAELDTEKQALASRPSFRVKSPISGVTWLSKFQSGHGWTALGTGGTVDLNNTEQPFFGTQSIKVTTATTSTANREVQKTGLGLDLTGKSLVLLVRTSTPEPILNVIRITAGNAGLSSYWQWDYGTGERILQLGDQWVAYEFPFESQIRGSAVGTPNRAAIDTIKIRVRTGTTGDAAVAWLGGIGTRPVVSGGTIVFSFDDSEPTHYTLARPILANAGFAGSAFTILERFDDPSYLTTAQAQEMQDMYGWDICAHCTTAANHVDFRTLTTEQLATELLTLKAGMKQRGFAGADLFATPLGVMDKTIAAEAAKYFASLRTTVGGTYGPYFGPAPTVPFNVQAHGWSNTSMTASTVTALIDTVKAQGTAAILNFHAIGTTATSYGIATADLETIVAYALSQNVAVKTFSQLMAGT